MSLRSATLADAEGLNLVYNPYIKESPVTFEIKEHSLADREDWLRRQMSDPRHPVIVAVGDEEDKETGHILGFANASPFDPRGGYGTSIKCSVFVRQGAGGQGLGAKLYSALFEVLEGQEIHRAYGLIVPPNPASVALHERFGFRHLATLNEVGRKFGRFHDVMWFEKRL